MESGTYSPFYFPANVLAIARNSQTGDYIMANNNTEVKTSGVVVASKDATEKMIQVNVTVIEDKEQALVVFNQTIEALTVAFSLQDDFLNESAYLKHAIQSAAVLFLKAECTARISKWQNLCGTMTGVQEYLKMTRPQVEAALKIHPKYSKLWKLAEKAIQIKAVLK